MLKYEKDKTNFLEIALSQNLFEKNVIYDATYREIMLRPIFILVNNEFLYMVIKIFGIRIKLYLSASSFRINLKLI